VSSVSLRFQAVVVRKEFIIFFSFCSCSSSPKPTESHSHIVQFGAPNFVAPNQGGGMAMGMVGGGDPADLHTFKEALALRTR
jgi:hypothetical protein